MAAPLTLVRIVRRLERRARRLLPLPQYRVLALAADSDASASRLSRRLGLAKPTITATVDALTESGLLVRTAVPGDRRQVRLEVTETGRATLADVESELTDAIDDLVTRCDDPGLVRTALEQLGDALDREAAERGERRAEGRN